MIPGEVAVIGIYKRRRFAALIPVFNGDRSSELYLDEPANKVWILPQSVSQPTEPQPVSQYNVCLTVNSTVAANCRLLTAYYHGSGIASVIEMVGLDNFVLKLNKDPSSPCEKGLEAFRPRRNHAFYIVSGNGNLVNNLSLEQDDEDLCGGSNRTGVDLTKLAKYLFEQLGSSDSVGAAVAMPNYVKLPVGPVEKTIYFGIYNAPK